MKLLVLLAICLVLVAAAPRPFTSSQYQTIFSAWKAQHQKLYGAHEEFHRFTTFMDNLDFVHETNQQQTQFELELNKFADLTNREWRELYVPHELSLPARTHYVHFDNTKDLPASVDWIAAKAVTNVKNQGSCGSCWAFSTAGSLEGALLIATKPAEVDAWSLSEQELVDCAGGKYGNTGCGGGLMDLAFEYVKDFKGLSLDKDYKYAAKAGTCAASKYPHFAPIASYGDVEDNSEDQLKAAVAQQPVSVAIEASGSAFQFYKSGVLTTGCGTRLDHGVLVAGYGTENGVDYWMVKNSWGEGWGQNGYVKIQRGSGTGKPGLCGIAMYASFPILAK